MPKSIGAGAIQAAAEYLTEKIPLKVLQAPGLSFLKRLAGGLVADVPGELIATATEMALIDAQILGKKYTVDDYKKALIDTIAVSGLTTLGATTVVHPFTKEKAGVAPATGVKATEDILAAGEKAKQEYIKKQQAFTVEDQLKAKQPEVYDQLKKEVEDAKRIREDEGQVSEGRPAEKAGAEEGSQNLEQQAPEQPGGERLGQERIGKERKAIFREWLN